MASCLAPLKPGVPWEREPVKEPKAPRNLSSESWGRMEAMPCLLDPYLLRDAGPGTRFQRPMDALIAFRIE